MPIWHNNNYDKRFSADLIKENINLPGNKSYVTKSLFHLCERGLRGLELLCIKILPTYE
jgi:hypothetical protein